MILDDIINEMECTEDCKAAASGEMPDDRTEYDFCPRCALVKLQADTFSIHTAVVNSDYLSETDKEYLSEIVSDFISEKLADEGREAALQSFSYTLMVQWTEGEFA